MALKKIPYRKASALIKHHLSTNEDPETVELIRQMLRGRDDPEAARRERMRVCCLVSLPSERPAPRS